MDIKSSVSDKQVELLRNQSYNLMKILTMEQNTDGHLNNQIEKCESDDSMQQFDLSFEGGERDDNNSSQMSSSIKNDDYGLKQRRGLQGYAQNQRMRALNGGEDRVQTDSNLSYCKTPGKQNQDKQEQIMGSQNYPLTDKRGSSMLKAHLQTQEKMRESLEDPEDSDRRTRVSKRRAKPMSAYSNKNKMVRRKSSKMKVENKDNQSVSEAANMVVQQSENDLDGVLENKTECISIDDITNCSDLQGQSAEENNEDENPVAIREHTDIDIVDFEIQNNKQDDTEQKKKQVVSSCKKKLSKIEEKEGENDNVQQSKNQSPTLKDQSDLRIDEDSVSNVDKPKDTKETTTKINGFDDITPEEMAKLQKIMGSNFVAKIEKPESALDFVSSRHRYTESTDRMAQKLKGIQDREEQRQKMNRLEYENKKNVNRTNCKTGRLMKDFADMNEEEKYQAKMEGTRYQEDLEMGFDPQEQVQLQHGWELYKRKKIPQTMVRRYCLTLDQDYTKHKITVCAHLNHIYDLYMNQRKPFMRNLADHIEKQRMQNMSNNNQNGYGGTNSGFGNYKSINRGSYGYGGNQSYSLTRSNFSNPVSGYYNGQFISQNQSAMLNAIKSQLSDSPLSIEEKEKDYNKKFGIINPNLSNQVACQPNYYKYQSEGISYQREQEKDSNPFTRSLNQDEGTRPLKRLYLNFDKDIAHKMFGYRVRHVEEDQTDYMGTGIPSAHADQSHKPIVHYTRDRLNQNNLLDRYARMEGYNTKQTIVKMLDSENEDDVAEIEKNRKLIKLNQRGGCNANNNNPKMKKRLKNLTWVFDKDTTPEQNNRPKRQSRPGSGIDKNYLGFNGSASPIKRRFGPPSTQKRFASNTLRYSQNTAATNGPHSDFQSAGLGATPKEPQSALISNYKVENMTLQGNQNDNRNSTQNQIGYQLPSNVQFNINLAGVGSYAQSQNSNLIYSPALANGQVQPPSNVHLASQSQVPGQGQQVQSNQSFIMSREKIEQQRAFLIEQLSKYPQAYNAYLLMNGMNMVQLKQQGTPQQTQSLTLQQVQQLQYQQQLNSLPVQQQQQTQSLERQQNNGGHPTNFQIAFETFQKHFGPQSRQEQLQNQVVDGSNTQMAHAIHSTDPSLNSKVLSASRMTVPQTSQNSTQQIIQSRIGQTSKPSSASASASQLRALKSPVNQMMDPTIQQQNQSETTTICPAPFIQTTNKFMSRKSVQKSSQSKLKVNEQALSNSIKNHNQTFGQQCNSQMGTTTSQGDANNKAMINGGLGGTYKAQKLSRTEKKSCVQQPLIHYNPSIGHQSRDQILVTQSIQQQQPSRIGSRKSLNTKNVQVKGMRSPGLNNHMGNNYVFAKQQELPHDYAASQYGHNQVDINQLILKNKVVENAIQIQNLQMQYFEQMQRGNNGHAAQRAQSKNLLQNMNGQSAFNGTRQSNPDNKEQTLQSGGNKANRTLNSLQSKSTHHGGNNTAGSNTESNNTAASNGEKFDDTPNSNQNGGRDLGRLSNNTNSGLFNQYISQEIEQNRQNSLMNFGHQKQQKIYNQNSEPKQAQNHHAMYGNGLLQEHTTKGQLTQSAFDQYQNQTRKQGSSKDNTLFSVKQINQKQFFNQNLQSRAAAVQGNLSQNESLSRQ